MIGEAGIDSLQGAEIFLRHWLPTSLLFNVCSVLRLANEAAGGCCYSPYLYSAEGQEQRLFMGCMVFTFTSWISAVSVTLWPLYLAPFGEKVVQAL